VWCSLLGNHRATGASDAKFLLRRHPASKRARQLYQPSAVELRTSRGLLLCVRACEPVWPDYTSAIFGARHLSLSSVFARCIIYRSGAALCSVLRLDMKDGAQGTIATGVEKKRVQCSEFEMPAMASGPDGRCSFNLLPSYSRACQLANLQCGAFHPV
ncbi:hypothetical protein SPRG_21809, partial [Saprolegnia parasitica CBS 223.65]